MVEWTVKVTQRNFCHLVAICHPLSLQLVNLPLCDAILAISVQNENKSDSCLPLEVGVEDHCDRFLRLPLPADPHYLFGCEVWLSLPPDPTHHRSVCSSAPPSVQSNLYFLNLSKLFTAINTILLSRHHAEKVKATTETVKKALLNCKTAQMSAEKAIKTAKDDIMDIETRLAQVSS